MLLGLRSSGVHSDFCNTPVLQYLTSKVLQYWTTYQSFSINLCEDANFTSMNATYATSGLRLCIHVVRLRNENCTFLLHSFSGFCLTLGTVRFQDYVTCACVMIHERQTPVGYGGSGQEKPYSITGFPSADSIS